MSQPSFAESIAQKIQKERREALSRDLKGKFQEYLKAKAVADNIMAEIVEKLESSGESAEGVQEILGTM